MAPRTQSKVTTDHEEIRRWAEARGAKPAAIIGHQRENGPGFVGLDLPGNRAGSLKEISWEEWFKQFEKKKLALLYQEHTANGEMSNFNNIISRNTAKEVESAVGGRGRSASLKPPSGYKRGAKAEPLATKSRGTTRHSTRSNRTV